MKVMGTYPDAFLETKVLEVGSLNINGSVRGFFFNPREYIGCDVGEGPGVDVVCPGEDLAYEDNRFDTVISTEMMEHNPNWIDTFGNMYRMLKPGGLMLMTCAGPGRPEHGTTRTDIGSSPLTVGIGWDYYRNLSESDFREHFDIEKEYSKYFFEYNSIAKDQYFWGIKSE